MGNDIGQVKYMPNGNEERGHSTEDLYELLPSLGRRQQSPLDSGKSLHQNQPKTPKWNFYEYQHCITRYYESSNIVPFYTGCRKIEKWIASS